MAPLALIPLAAAAPEIAAGAATLAAVAAPEIAAGAAALGTAISAAAPEIALNVGSIIVPKVVKYGVEHSGQVVKGAKSAAEFASKRTKDATKLLSKGTDAAKGTFKSAGKSITGLFKTNKNDKIQSLDPSQLSETSPVRENIVNPVVRGGYQYNTSIHFNHCF